MEKKYELNSIVEMKKNHACGTNEWKVIRMGVDIKLKCVQCGREVMMDRLEFERKLRRIISEKGQEN